MDTLGISSLTVLPPVVKRPGTEQLLEIRSSDSGPEDLSLAKQMLLIEQLEEAKHTAEALAALNGIELS